MTYRWTHFPVVSRLLRRNRKGILLLFIIQSETFRESFHFFLFFVCLSVLSGIFGLGVYSICRILRRTLELDFPSTKRFNYAGTLRRQNCNLRVFLYTAREKIVFWIHKSNRLKNDKQFYGKSFHFTYFYLYEKKK